MNTKLKLFSCIQSRVELKVNKKKSLSAQLKCEIKTVLFACLQMIFLSNFLHEFNFVFYFEQKIAIIYC